MFARGDQLRPIIGKPVSFNYNTTSYYSSNDLYHSPFGTQDIWFNAADHTQPFPSMVGNWQWDVNLWIGCVAGGTMTYLVGLSGIPQNGDGTFQIDLLDENGVLVQDIYGNPLTAPYVSVNFSCNESPNPALFQFTVTLTTLIRGSGIFKKFNAIRFTGNSTNTNIGLIGGPLTALVYMPTTPVCVLSL